MKMNNKIGKWTKKLDEMHYYFYGVDSCKTLCGKVMLGNNYAEYFPDREVCKTCRRLKKDETN